MPYSLLPSSGTIALSEVRDLFYPGTSNISLSGSSSQIGLTPPHAMSELYGEAPFRVDNLICHYDALGSGSSSSTTWNDQTPDELGLEAQNMTLINGAGFTTVGGIDALYLDGVNDRTSATVGPGRSDFKSWRLNPITIEIWFRSNGSFLNNGNLYHNGFNNEIRIRFTSAGYIFVLANGMGSNTYTTSTWSTNTWYHLVVTIDSSGDLRIYRNGSLFGSDTTGTYNPTYGSAGYSTHVLGSNTSTTEFGRFYVGLLRTYNASFSSTDVTRNYNAEKARFGY